MKNKKLYSSRNGNMKNQKIYSSRNGNMRIKKLYRSRNGKAIAGICAGLGKYGQIDPVIIRLGFIFLALAGPGVIIYVIMWVVVPEEP